MSNLISLAEKIIGIYNKFLNKAKTENEFVQELNKLVPIINKWYLAQSELDLPPKDLKNWCLAYTVLAGTIHDFTMLYNEYGLSKITFDNRIACMNVTKERHYENLEKLRLEEQLAHSVLYSKED